MPKSSILCQNKDMTDRSLSALLTQEEHESVLHKMKEIAEQPAGHMPHQDEVYFEQQLADMLGFEVTAELEGNRLPHSIGIMEARPHVKRHPNDSLDAQEVYREAGLERQRSRFGWFTEHGQLTPEGMQRAQYHLAVPADFLPLWQSNYAEALTWWKWRKMIVINPFEQRAVVTVVGDLGPREWPRRQFAGSPAVIREGLVWSVNTRGRVIVFFVNDLTGNIPLGPVNLRYTEK